MFSVTGKLAQPLVGTEGEIWIVSNGYISFHEILDQMDNLCSIKKNLLIDKRGKETTL